MSNTFDDHSVKTILTLDREIWHQGLKLSSISLWGDQFDGQTDDIEIERTLALAMLAQFMFFGLSEIRGLCGALYDEHIWTELALTHRRNNNDTTDDASIEAAVREELNQTVFVGPGNPSESATHLLYHFRVANDLPLKLFISPFDLLSLHDDDLASLRRIVVIDDICASGYTAQRYYQDLIEPLLRRHPDAAIVESRYLTLLGTTDGLERANRFLRAQSAMILDETYICFGPESRYFAEGNRISQVNVTVSDASRIFEHYGMALCHRFPLGYGDCQLLVGFDHNIPDNTLPHMWKISANPRWQPIFRRFEKREDWDD